MSDPISKTFTEKLVNDNTQLSLQILGLQEQIKELKETNGDLNVKILILRAQIKELNDEISKDNNFFS